MTTKELTEYNEWLALAANMRLAGALEDIIECETFAELFNVAWQIGVEEQVLWDNPLVQGAINTAYEKLRLFGEVILQPTRIEQQVTITRQPRVKADHVYRIDKVEVDWTEKPQVVAIMQVIGAHVQPGAELLESNIVEMLVANYEVLGAHSPERARKAWEVYKGDHELGLTAHGNISRIR